MGLIRSFLDRFEKREFSLARWEAWLDSLGSAQSSSGMIVSQDHAITSTVVWGCLMVKSQDIAKLPLPVYQRLGKNGEQGRQEAPWHNLYPIFKYSFNPVMTAYTGRQTLEYWLSVNGNGYALKGFDGSGRVVQLWPLLANRMEPTLDNEPLYWKTQLLIDRWQDVRYIYTPESGIPMSFRPDQIFHLQGMSKNGITGLSPVEVHRETIGLNLAYGRHASKTFSNGARMPFIVEAPSNLGPEKAKELATALNEQYGGINAPGYQKIGVLYGGAQAKQLGFNNVDAEFLGSQQRSVEELCRIWRVSPHKVMDFLRATFSNVRELNEQHVNDCLSPDQTLWEQSIEQQLMTQNDRDNGYYVEHNNESLLKGTPVDRKDVDVALVAAGISTINEVRRSRNWNPVRGGDKNRTQVQNVPIDSKPLPPKPINQEPDDKPEE